MSQSNREIERRFLCLLPSEPAARQKRILQGYLKTGDPSTRLRRVEGRYEVTRKAGSVADPSGRDERNKDVDQELGEWLLEASAPRHIHKVRHVDGRWEIDVFDGRLRGLIIAECEMDGPGEALPDLPVILEGRVLFEVTTRLDLTNEALCQLDEESAGWLVESLYREAGAGVPDPGPEFLPGD